MEGVPLVEVRVHPIAPLLHLPVIVGAGQGGQHEEGGLIRLDHIHEVLDVLGDLRLGVEGEADDIGGVDDDARLVPLARMS